jgi:hypothetical protein
VIYEPKSSTHLNSGSTMDYVCVFATEPDGDIVLARQSTGARCFCADATLTLLGLPRNGSVAPRRPRSDASTATFAEVGRLMERLSARVIR